MSEAFSDSEAHLLALLVDVQRQTAEATHLLEPWAAQAQSQRQRVHEALLVWRAQKNTLEGLQKKRTALISKASQTEQKINRFQHELTGFRKKLAQISKEVASDAERGVSISARLRRERVNTTLQIREHEDSIAQETQALEALKSEIKEVVQAYVPEWDLEIKHRASLESLQKHLPKPSLIVKSATCALAYVHVQYRLSRDFTQWKKGLEQVYADLLPLYRDMREGFYRVDKHSALLAGRSRTTVDVLCALVVAGKHTEALKWFEVVADREAYFHSMYEIFRMWCFGFYLTENHEALSGLLVQYAHTEYAQGAYVQAFTALLQDDAYAFNKALKALLEWECDTFTGPADPVSRSLSVVSVGASALVVCAKKRGIDVLVDDPQLIKDRAPKQTPSGR
jgi:hypothetical protein